MNPDQTPKGISLIRVHTVGFHEKIKSEVHLNICSRHKSLTTFSGQTNSDGIWLRVNVAFVAYHC